MRTTNIILNKTVKRISYLFCLLFLYNMIWAQNKIPNNYQRIGGVFVDSTSPDFPYLRWNGSSVVDIRKMTESEKMTLSKYERIMDIQNDGRFPNAFYSFHDNGSSIQIGYPAGIKDTLFHRGNENMSTIIQAQIPVELAAVNITTENANQYLYHIVQNDQTEIVHWQKPTNFIYTKDRKYQYAYLGKFEAAKEKLLRVEMYNIHNYKDGSKCFIDWRTIKTFTYKDIYVQYTHKGGNGFYSGILNLPERNSFTSFIETENEHDFRIRMGDSLVNIALWNNYNAPYFYEIEIFKEHKRNFIDVIQNEVKIPYNVWNTPGKYTVKITPVLSTRYWADQRPSQNGRDVVLNQYTTSFSFTVLPPLHQKFTFSKTQMILFLVGVGMLIFFIWWYVRQKAQLKIVQANFQKEKNVLELSSLRN